MMLVISWISATAYTIYSWQFSITSTTCSNATVSSLSPSTACLHDCSTAAISCWIYSLLGRALICSLMSQSVPITAKSISEESWSPTSNVLGLCTCSADPVPWELALDAECPLPGSEKPSPDVGMPHRLPEGHSGILASHHWPLGILKHHGHVPENPDQKLVNHPHASWGYDQLPKICHQILSDHDQELVGHLWTPESNDLVLESRCLELILPGQVFKSRSQVSKSCATRQPRLVFKIPRFTTSWFSAILVRYSGSAVSSHPTCWVSTVPHMAVMLLVWHLLSFYPFEFTELAFL